jgi:hypothetical protein
MLSTVLAYTGLALLVCMLRIPGLYTTMDTLAKMQQLGSTLPHTLAW